MPSALIEKPNSSTRSLSVPSRVFAVAAGEGARDLLAVLRQSPAWACSCPAASRADSPTCRQCYRASRLLHADAHGRKELVREEGEWRRIAAAIMRVLGP